MPKWINPRYRELTGREPPGSPREDEDGMAATAWAQAPRDDGIRLATLPRNVKGMREELRVSLATFEGHRYLSLRIWSQDRRSGQWWPVKGKGCSIKLREAREVADALLDGLRRAEEMAACDEEEAPRRSASHGTRPATAQGFDEFT